MLHPLGRTPTSIEVICGCLTDEQPADGTLALRSCGKEQQGNQLAGMQDDRALDKGKHPELSLHLLPCQRRRLCGLCNDLGLDMQTDADSAHTSLSPSPAFPHSPCLLYV